MRTCVKTASLAMLVLVAPGETGAATRYLDDGRAVSVERLGAGEAGRTRVRLALRGRSAIAEVGREAIVALGPAGERRLAEEGLVLRRWLLRGRGLALVSGASSEDGVDVAARLAPKLHPNEIASAIPDLYLRRVRATIDTPPNDPRYGGQWFLKRIDVESAWKLTAGAPSVAIAIVDDGCDLTHEDLAGAFLPGRDVLDGDDDPSYSPGSNGNAHGTACAGLAAARANNGLGVTGVCPECSLRCIRLLAPSDGLVPLSADIGAFDFASQNGVAVVSNSWGFEAATAVPDALRVAIESFVDEARDGKGGVVVFAAGNENRELADDEVTGVRGVVTVGAINVFDEAAPFSNHGATVTLTAPTGTLTTDISGTDGFDPGNYTSTFGGTSSAAPLVAGVAGLLFAAAPDATGARVREVLVATARPAPFATPDADGHDPTYGYGIVDPTAALRQLLGLAETDGGAGDGGVPAADGGPPPAPTGGGSCAAGGGSLGGGWAALGLWALLRARRRRRSG